jgi:hypothetical protein
MLKVRQCDSNALWLCMQFLRRMVRSAVRDLRCHWGTKQRQIGRITCHVMMIHWLQHVVDKCQCTMIAVQLDSLMRIDFVILL